MTEAKTGSDFVRRMITRDVSVARFVDVENRSLPLRNGQLRIGTTATLLQRVVHQRANVVPVRTRRNAERRDTRRTDDKSNRLALRFAAPTTRAYVRSPLARGIANRRSVALVPRYG
jgi:hypothetical protein